MMHIWSAYSRMCENGPTSEYYQPHEDTHYYPEIYVKRCSGNCPNDGDFKWVLIALREIKTMDDIYCECEGCSDIHDYHQCLRTSPCPNSNLNTSFYYWKPFHGHHLISPVSISVDRSSIPRQLWGSCDCCKYIQCKPGQYFDRQLCKCLCHPAPCSFPRIQDPDTCECVCPQKHDCTVKTKGLI